MQFGLSESQNSQRQRTQVFRRRVSARNATPDGIPITNDAALGPKLTDQGYTGIIFPEEYAESVSAKSNSCYDEEAGRHSCPVRVLNP